MAISTNSKNEAKVKAASMAKAASRSPLFYACILGILCSAVVAHAWYLYRPSVPRAEQLLAMGEPQKAVAMLEELATKGDGKASMLLGSLYFAGRLGVGRDHVRAMPFLGQAAATHPEARVQLASIAYHGTAGSPDYELAQSYLVPLESSGMGDALALLGQMYFYGRGVEQDVERAGHLLQQAIDTDEGEEARQLLGQMYYKGLGVEQNYDLAENLLRRVAPGTDPEIDLLLAELYFLGLNGARDLPRAKVRLGAIEKDDDARVNYYRGMVILLDRGKERDVDAARVYLENALRLGETAANYPLGRMFYLGEIGGTPDYRESLRYLEPAVAEGNDEAKALLGEMYYFGRGVPRDFAKAVRYLEDALALREPAHRYSYILGLMYYTGQGVEKDYDKAAGHVMYEANRGNLDAMVLMATMYYHGTGVGKNMDRAVEYLEKPLQAKIPEALALRGRMYYFGDGGDWDEPRARELLREAAAAGIDEAGVLLRQSEAREMRRRERLR